MVVFTLKVSFSKVNKSQIRQNEFEFNVGRRTIVYVGGAFIDTLASWWKIQSRLILLLCKLLITEMLDGSTGKLKS